MTISYQSVKAIESVATTYTTGGQTAATIKDAVTASAIDTQSQVNAGVSAAQLVAALAVTVGKELPGGNMLPWGSLYNNAQQIQDKLESGFPVPASLVHQALSDVAAIAGSEALLVAAALGSPLAAGTAAALILTSAALTIVALADGDAAVSPELQSLLANVYSALQGMISTLGLVGASINDLLGQMGDRLSSGFLDLAFFISDGTYEIAHIANDFFLLARGLWRRDPLALDLDGDGIETVGVDAGVLFDHNADGIKTGTGWLKGDDAFLVLDRNGNGVIDSGRELFGVDTLVPSDPFGGMGFAADGFVALSAIDGNGDKVFDAGDAEFANVRLWRDLNQDGISQAEELQSLAAAGITAINLTTHQASKTLPGGNTQTLAADVAGIDGGAVSLNLADNPFYRQFPDHLDTTAVADLPDMSGSGTLRDLREAATQSAALASDLRTLATQGYVKRVGRGAVAVNGEWRRVA